jgi:uncharacterized membrane protein YhaH (DUF805 family)
MDSVKKLEVMVATWYKNVPHLPVTGQKWLSENMWWLTLIAVVLGVIGIIQLIVASFLLGGLMTGGIYGVAFDGLVLLTVIFTMIFALVSLVLSAMAISPLRTMQKKGWLLLFIVLLISVLSDVISLVLNWNFFSFIFSLLFTAVGGYFLYEIRSYFGKVHVNKRA